MLLLDGGDEVKALLGLALQPLALISDHLENFSDAHHILCVPDNPQLFLMHVVTLLSCVECRPDVENDLTQVSP